MNSFNPFQSYQKELLRLEQNDHLRTLKRLDKSAGGQTIWEDKTYINLSSNDYLGLATDKKLHEEFYNAIDQDFEFSKHGLSAASSRLLTGNDHIYETLEKTLANLYNKDTALVFNSGYHANIGIIQALSSQSDLIISDELIHASMIDGIRLCKSEKLRFRHGDYDDLDQKLAAVRAQFDKVFIVAESIYSMDGDIANIARLVEVKNKYKAFLYLDEAHALGVRGRNGLGLAEEQGLIGQVEFLVGTFGKAIASQGAFLVCNSTIRSYLINKMRSLIFTTGLPPVSLSWTNFVMQQLPDFTSKREQLASIAQQFKSTFQSLKGVNKSESHIVPIIVGDNKTATKLAEKIADEGFLCFPIRTPTVPPGTARLRFSLTANHIWEDLQKLEELIF